MSTNSNEGTENSNSAVNENQTEERKAGANESENQNEAEASGGEDKQPDIADHLTAQLQKFLKVSEEAPPESVLEEVTFEGIAKYIKSDKCKNIVVMAGAGISTSAGIPDFRSPGTGLYDNLQKYNLPSPQAVFSIDYFRENPEPFFMLCKELYPGTFKPTPCHYFIKLLDEKKKLLRHFTQNIDTLERVAGLGDERVVEAHGTFATAHCMQCRHLYDQQWLKDKIFSGSEDETVIPKCGEPDCEGVVKPDIVFFGECLPFKFVSRLSDLKECDLLIILGTSLVVQPFASLAERVERTTPRLYINLQKTVSGTRDPVLAMLMGGNSFAFDSEDNIRDVYWQGTCDDGCYALADLLGWGDEFRELVKTQHEILDKEEEEKKANL